MAWIRNCCVHREQPTWDPKEAGMARMEWVWGRKKGLSDNHCRGRGPMSQWSSAWGDFDPQWTSGKVWRHLRLSNSGGERIATNTWWVEARDMFNPLQWVAQNPTTENDPVPNAGHTGVEKSCCKVSGLLIRPLPSDRGSHAEFEMEECFQKDQPQFMSLPFHESITSTLLWCFSSFLCPHKHPPLHHCLPRLGSHALRFTQAACITLASPVTAVSSTLIWPDFLFLFFFLFF